MRLVSKHAQVGYQTPGERPGCRNCAHINRIETTGFTLCVKHGFEVTSGGICNSHKLQRKAGEAELAFLARQGDLLKHQVQELQPRLVDTRVFPSVGEMYEGKVMTVAKHRRLMVEQLIANEEASGDPDLVRVAAMRRRCIGMAPQARERRA
ncbi:hypothetical protein [Diaphorobacter sp.]|uniref:hypothetical protein n=1 Tax=Diaphorobacter sp. TaxID=1934310 RepID=UPI0025846B13|nr:hypothetical protein [Diaphorobacter sp.]